MRKHTSDSIDPELESQLAALYRPLPPDPAFADRLERTLIARAAGLSSTRTQRAPLSLFSGLRARPAWAGLALAALILALAVVVAGPQQVLAGMQHLLGYVPGVGFVDLDQARVLPAPVAVTRDGVTLQVENALAHPRGTVLLISTQGLPPQDNFSSGFNSDQEFTPILRLSDGQAMQVRAAEYSYGWAKLEFGPLPAEVSRVYLELDLLPQVAPGAAPEDWQVLLTLVPLQGELAPDQYPQPYTPVGASDTVNGVTMSVIGVAQSARETGLQIQVSWEDPAWRWFSSPSMVLLDEIGHVYQEISSSQASAASVVAEAIEEGGEPAAGPPASVETHVFAPFSLAARQATLEIDRVSFMVPADETFTFLPGPEPKIGQVWPLDVQLQVAGIPLHIVGAQLKDDSKNWEGEAGPFYSLEFILEAAPADDRSLNTLLLENPDARGASYSWGAGSRGVAALIFQRRLPMVVEVTIQEAGIDLEGPWNLTWELITPMDVDYSLRELHPAQALDEVNGLTLSVAEVLISDRLTVVNVGASGLPAGAAVKRLAYRRPAGPAGWPDIPALEDQRGQEVEGEYEVGWRAPLQSSARQVVFSNPSPLARSLTLTIPGIELTLPGAAELAVEIPADLEFREEVYETNVLSYDGTEHLVSRSRWVSDWAVDIPVEIAGYRLHFTRAEVEQVEDLAAGRFWLTLYSEALPAGIEGQELVELHFAKITRPDGEIQQIDYGTENWKILSRPTGGIVLAESAPGQQQPFLRIAVSGSHGLALLPGLYTIELDGASISVPGPWRLEWSLAEH